MSETLVKWRFMQSIVFFNNKGGVGKTTLACNFAYYLSTFAGKRALVLDLDPQCNSTQLLLEEDEWEKIYGFGESSTTQTILLPLRGIRGGDSFVYTEEFPIRSSPRFKCDIIPGHPGLSALEDLFGGSWRDFRGGDTGGARRSAWLRVLLSSLGDLYDIAVIDVGPSLGAINRSVLVGSDYFVTPMAPDLFSLFALDNIAGWLDRWLGEYQRARTATVPALVELGFDDIAPEMLPISQGFLGYTVQQYYTTIRGGQRRRIMAYDRHRAEIPERAAGLVSLSRFSADELDLGTVPNMFSMIPLAQSRHAPVIGLSKQDGVLGAQVNQQRRYSEQLRVIFEAMTSRLQVGQVLP
jgi:cellulose biosynthesis protein BcsQ